MSKKITLGLIPFVCAFIIPVLIRSAYIPVPLERDEGAYAYGASRIMAGDVLYRDMVDFTPPGIFYLYAVCISLVGESIDDIRLFTIAYVFIALIWMYVLARRLFGIHVAWIAAGILGFISSEPIILGFTANKETFMLLPIIGSSHLFIKGMDEKKPWLIICAGLLCGAGFFIKQVMVYYLAGLLIFGACYRWENIKKCAKHFSFFFAGFFAATALVTGYFFIAGALKEFIYWVIQYPFAFADTPLEKSFVISYLWERVRSILASDILFWLASIYGLVVLCKQKTWQGLFLIIMTISLWAAVSAGLRFRHHYFILLTPAVALTAAWGIMQWIQGIQKITNKAMRYGLTAIMIACIIGIPLYAQGAYLFIDSSREISRKLYGANPFIESKEIASYIQKNTNDRDTIFVMGSEPQIYFYAKRKNPTNQLFVYPLTASYGPASRYQREVVSAVKKALPFYIIWFDIQTSWYASEPVSDRYVFDEIASLVKQKYVLDGYVLIGRHESVYKFGVNAVAPAHAQERIPIYLYKKKRLSD